MPSQTQQRAVLVNEIGKPVLLGTRDVSAVKNHQVLVKVTATMLLPHDAYGRDWGLFIAEYLPYVLGSNVTGIIEQVGTSVSNFEIGDHIVGLADVMGPFADQSGLQEYAVLNSNAIAKIPEKFSKDEAVTLPTNLMTAFTVLYTTKFGFGFPVPWEGSSGKDGLENETVVIIGGGTVVAKFGIQFAKLSGVGRIIVVAGIRNKGELEKLGATHVIDRTGAPSDIATQVNALTGPSGATKVWDTANLTFELATEVLSKTSESRLITLLPIEKPSSDVLAKEKPKANATFVEGSNANMAPYTQAFWDHVPGWLTEGSIKPAEYRTVDGLEQVDEINTALDGYMSGKGGKQLIVHP